MAALDAAGAALGSLGMLGFALCFAALVKAHVLLAFSAAFLAWTIVSGLAWLAWRYTRVHPRRALRTGARARVRN